MSELKPQDTEADAVAELAQQALTPESVDPAFLYTVADGARGVRLLDLEPYRENPRRATGHRKVLDAASFVSYLEKHGLRTSEVWANTPTSEVVALINTHEGADKPGGWGDHRLALDLVKSPAWRAWEAIDGQLMGQVEFAEFIELRALDVREPDAAHMLDLAQHFTAKRSVEYESSEKLDNGEVQLLFKESTAAKAGQKGTLDIPERLQLVLRPYIGGPAYFVWARFRYRLHGAQLSLGIVIERPQEILDAAFVDIVTEIREGKHATTAAEATETSPSVIAAPGHEGIKQPIFYGRPQ